MLLRANENEDLLAELNDLRGQLAEKSIDPERDFIVPVINLAESGIKGWKVRSSSTAMYVAAPPDIAKAGGFAVVAAGESLAPAGIPPGCLLFCSPKQTPIPGDIVYIEKKNGHVTINRYVGEVGQNFALVLEGWLPRRDHSTPPQSFSLEVKTSTIQQIAPVIYVKRRL